MTNLDKNHFVSRVIPSCLITSARTLGVAVAVSAIKGMPRKNINFSSIYSNIYIWAKDYQDILFVTASALRNQVGSHDPTERHNGPRQLQND